MLDFAAILSWVSVTLSTDQHEWITYLEFCQDVAEICRLGQNSKRVENHEFTVEGRTSESLMTSRIRPLIWNMHDREITLWMCQLREAPPKDRLEPMLYIFPVNCLLDQQVCFSGGQKQTKQNINGDICLKAKICKKNRIGNAPSHPFGLFPDIHPFWQEWASLN